MREDAFYRRDPSGMRRVFVYYLWQSERYFLYILGGGLLFAVYMAIISGGNFLEELKEAAPSAMWYMTAMMVVLGGLQGTQAWFPMTLSFGGKRANTFLGSLCANLLLCIQVVLVDVVIQRVSFGEVRFGIPTLTGIVLAMQVVSALIGMVSMRYGKRGVTRVLLVIAGGCVGVGAFLLTMSSDASQPIVSGLALGLLWITTRRTQLLVGAILLYLLLNFIIYRMLYKYEVKF